MHPKRIHKILEDENIFDVAKAPEAILEDARMREKRLRPRKLSNSAAAYRKIKERVQEEEDFRRKLSDFWKKTHK